MDQELDQEFSDQGTKAELGKGTRECFGSTSGMALARSGIKQPESRSSFVAILPCAGGDAHSTVICTQHPNIPLIQIHPSTTATKPQPGKGPRI